MNKVLLLASTAVLFAAPALAQNADNSSADSNSAKPGATATAQKCLADLRQVSEQMRSDGYSLTSWGTRWGYGMPAVGPAPLAPAAAPATQSGTSGSSTATSGQSPGATTASPPPGRGVGPYGVAYGTMTPRYQIRALYAAANVLGHRGDEQTCQAVLAELRQVTDSYGRQLQAAGVQPDQVTSWRQQQLVAARPVTQLKQGLISIDDLTGTDVRNARDKLLGTVDDVVLDPKSGGILYLIVARGGFLGIGTDYVAVPWRQIKATPSMNTLVLDVPEKVVADAPAVNPDRFANSSDFGQRRTRIDQYWSQHMRG
jgi:sporulation protein YlmC with PRC-barrel domain